MATKYCSVKSCIDKVTVDDYFISILQHILYVVRCFYFDSFFWRWFFLCVNWKFIYELNWKWNWLAYRLDPWKTDWFDRYFVWFFFLYLRWEYVCLITTFKLYIIALHFIPSHQLYVYSRCVCCGCLVHDKKWH